jgi:DNA-binding FadR family transcriptional regulator
MVQSPSNAPRARRPRQGFERIAKTVARRIVREIANKRLQPGAPLPTEPEMESLYGVGRWSLREALRLLEAQGLIEIRRGASGGNFVGSPTGADFGETLTMYLQVGGTTIRSLYEAFVLYEGSAAYLAAQRVRDGAIKQQDIDALMAIGYSRDLVEHDTKYFESAEQFHHAISGFCDNLIIELVVGAAAHLIENRTTSPEEKIVDLEQRSVTLDYHAKIASAISSGEPQLARLWMEEHMTNQMLYFAEHDPASLDEVLDWR